MPNVLSPRDLVSRPDNMDERTCFLESSNGIMLSREHKQKKCTDYVVWMLIYIRYS